MIETLIIIILIPIALIAIIFSLGIVVGVFRYIFNGGGKRGRKETKSINEKTTNSP